MRWWWGRRGAKRAHVPVGGVGEDFGDQTGPAPSNNVLRSSSGALDLGVGGRHVDLDTIVELKVGGSAVLIESFGCFLLHIGVVRSGEAMEGGGGCLQGLSECGGRNGEVGSSQGTSLSGWGKAVIAGMKGETGGEPKSISKGHRPPRDSWETEL